MAFCCPRCGYNLRGIIQTWNQTGACPLTGKCSECGFDFNWKRVFEIPDHPWLFEYHWRRNPIRSFFTTLYRSAFPWKFWREIDLFWPVRIWPIVVMIIILLITTLAALIGGIIKWRLFNHDVHWVNWRYLMGYPVNKGPWFSTYYSMTYYLRESFIIAGTIAWAVAVPFAFGLLPISLSRAKVRKAHLIRVFCYSILIFVPIVFVVSQLMAYYQQDINQFMIIQESIVKWLGTGVVWVLKNILHIHGIGREEKELFVYSLLPGFFFIPYWWFACSRYLKLETPIRVMAAVSVVSTLLVVAVTVLFQFST